MTGAAFKIGSSIPVYTTMMAQKRGKIKVLSLSLLSVDKIKFLCYTIN